MVDFSFLKYRLMFWDRDCQPGNDGGVFHYRDKSELECDLVIKLHVDKEKMNSPSFLMVLYS